MLFEEEDNVTSVPPPFTLIPIVTPSYECTGDINRNSCYIDYHEHMKRDAIAGIRMVTSVLSIIGSLSIIFSAIYRRTYQNPKVLPIFVLSIADFLLACTWIVGGTMWFGEISDRVWCIFPSLFSVMLVCISANLTLVYAWSSYDNLKEKSFTNILANTGVEKNAWRPMKSLAIFGGACSLPVIVMLLGFAILEGIFKLMHQVRACSCWCVPYFGNVVPLAYEHDAATANFSEKMRYIVAIYGYLVGTNYLLVFVLLVYMYWKILRWIRILREQNRTRRSQAQYGAVDVLLLRSQSQARKRVVYFLTVFTIIGLANLLLGYLFAIFESIKINRSDWTIRTTAERDHLDAFLMILYTIQSVTVPAQGFLNALVYGWTREDFVHTIMHRRHTSGSRFSDEGSMINSGSYRSSILASRALNANKGYTNSRSYKSLNTASEKFK